MNLQQHYSSNSMKDFITGVAFVSTFPPRACGIATFTTDLINAIEEKFSENYHIRRISLEARDMQLKYKVHPHFILLTSERSSYENFVKFINNSDDIDILCIQHEFGLYYEQL